jgi:hypothetical protein
VKKASANYPEKLAMIIEAYDESVKALPNPKFLMPKVFSVADVATIIRKKLALDKNHALILFAQKGSNNKFVMLSSELRITHVHDQYKDPQDNMLYLVYAKENVFGAL